MIKQRFKTEKEFIAEFGKDWNSSGSLVAIPWNWSGEMDYLFGKNYSRSIIKDWYITDNMLTDNMLTDNMLTDAKDTTGHWADQFEIVQKELKKLNDIEKEID